MNIKITAVIRSAEEKEPGLYLYKTKKLSFVSREIFPVWERIIVTISNTENELNYRLTKIDTNDFKVVLKNSCSEEEIELVTYEGCTDISSDKSTTISNFFYVIGSCYKIDISKREYKQEEKK